MSRASERPQPIRPRDAVVTRLRVVRTARVSPGFVRVTLLADDPAFTASFRSLGHDQWFRLFFDHAKNGPLLLPDGGAEGWHSRLLAMPEDRRCTVRNYTVRDARRLTGRLTDRWEFDVDFVVHTGPDGEVEGAAANWALGLLPGDEAGLLDQGLLFTPPTTPVPMTIVAEETGLPGVEGIARSLPAGVRATLLLEVPHPDDRRELHSAADLDVHWLPRADPADAPGQAALAALATRPPAPESYVYAAGEAGFVREAKQLAQHAGVPADRIDARAYWRLTRPRTTTPA
ncbi:siderophore-interacting protein [Streptomyces sp. XM4193]|uniref:siderophore-interacting protein n=1 Tax=Streptomyces sp. XM4193 TaxID=2929782 RepID=UPI001FF74AFD|nr:siderophore-interacting protein [Streptomyces sp. XM4193]MCK1798072.1 siderophore-interacting protein [Streptomyces sp. XM4193]